jgi:hypothetical protein
MMLLGELLLWIKRYVEANRFTTQFEKDFSRTTQIQTVI